VEEGNPLLSFMEGRIKRRNKTHVARVLNWYYLKYYNTRMKGADSTKGNGGMQRFPQAEWKSAKR
jgi:hypothetical protein